MSNKKKNDCYECVFIRVLMVEMMLPVYSTSETVYKTKRAGQIKFQHELKKQPAKNERKHDSLKFGVKSRNKKKHQKQNKKLHTHTYNAEYDDET